jgi:hypothetical protein
MNATLYQPPARARSAANDRDWAEAALLSNLLIDLAEWLGAAWAIGVPVSHGEMQQASFCGAPPDRRACLDYVTSLICDGHDSPHEWQLQIAPREAQDLLPQLVAWSGTAEGTYALAFGPKIRPEGYSSSDCSLVLDACRLYTLRADLAVACDVQRRSLPLRFPRIHGLDYHGDSLPAAGLGGAFYDFIQLDDNSLAVSLGDVSGPGISSALLMSGLQAYVRGLTARKQADIGLIIAELNRISYDISPDNFFSALFYAQVDTANHRLQYVNAGHEPALLIRSGCERVEYLESTGTVLGLSYKSSFAVAGTPVYPGDTFVAWANGNGDCEERVLAALRDDPCARASDLVESIVEPSSGGEGPTRESDNRTLVVARFTEAMARGAMAAA